MGIYRRGIGYTPGTQKVCQQTLSPRMKNALWLYESSIVPTKCAAARAVGLAPQTFYQATSGANSALAESTYLAVEQRVMSIREKIEALSHRAIDRLGDLMESGDEQVALRAAIDVADRGQETAKIQKMEVMPTMKSEDIQALARGLVEAARVRALYSGVGQEDIIQTETDGTSVASQGTPFVHINSD